MSCFNKYKNRVNIPALEPSLLDSETRFSFLSKKAEPEKTPSNLALKKTKNSQFHQIKSDNHIKALKTDLTSLKTDVNKLAIKTVVSQENFVKKEQEYRQTLVEIEAKLKQIDSNGNLKVLDTTKQKVEEIQKNHKKIMGNLSAVQEKTLLLLRGQEVEIIKELNLKLQEKFEELEKERQAVQDTLGKKGKESELIEELEKLKSKVDDIDYKNKKYSQKNFQLKIIQKSHAEDKQILNKQIENLKQINKKLKIKAAADKPGRLTPQPFIRDSTPSPERVYPNRQQDVINKLKKMIELETKNCRAARTAYARELEAKRELEKFLRDAVDDVKGKITEKKNEQRLGNDSDFDDLEKVVEILLSQERVLTLLYDKAFPHKGKKEVGRIELTQRSLQGIPSFSVINNVEL
jgi:hypothetical protein